MSDVYLISGMSCGGKTTYAKRLFDAQAGDALLLCQDSWYCDLDDIPRLPNGWRNMECPEAFHTEEFTDAVKTLAAGGHARIPLYDVAANRRTGFFEAEGAKTLIVEGLHTILFLKEYLPLSVAVYLDTPVRVCCERRVQRDTSHFHIPAEQVRTHFYQAVSSPYAPYARAQKALADQIISFEAGGQHATVTTI